MNWLAGVWAKDPVAAALRVSTSGTASAEERARACATLEEQLRRPDLLVRKKHRLTASGRNFVVLTTDGLKLVWKPGEALGKREEAAYQLDKRMGHAALVPPMVFRELEGQKGALRFFLKAKPSILDARRNYILQCPERPNYARLAVLDCLLGNRDRHAGNWLVTAGGTSIPIDHGLTFPRQNQTRRIHAYDFVQPVPVKLERLEVDDLAGLIGPEAVQALKERQERLLAEGRTYRWWDPSEEFRPSNDAPIDSFEAEFALATGLNGLHVSNPDDYAVLLDHIEVHRYYLGQERQSDVALPEAAASWQRAVFEPAHEAMREGGLLREFPRRTPADLYLWLTYHRERMQQPDRSVAGYLASRFSGRPWPRFWKAINRTLTAALQAARERPEPPGLRAEQ